MDKVKLREYIDGYIDSVIGGIKKEVMEKGEMPPVGFMFFHYPTRGNGQFGLIPIPYLDKYLGQHPGSLINDLPVYIQKIYDTTSDISSKLKVDVPDFQAELGGLIIIMDGLYLHHKDADISTGKEAIMIIVDMQEIKFTYYYTYTRLGVEIRKFDEKITQESPELLYGSLFPKTN